MSKPSKSQIHFRVFVLVAVLMMLANVSAEAVPGCPNAWDRFWADEESCADREENRTCCYWEDDALIGCCHTYATSKPPTTPTFGKLLELTKTNPK
jgi:hypothetical protein